jgi:hypothetical protein
VITWTTEYYGMAIAELRAQGRDVPDELLGFIAPGHRENINFFGFINVDVEAELAKLIEGWRPLRPTTVTDGWHHLHAPPLNDLGSRYRLEGSWRFAGTGSEPLVAVTARRKSRPTRGSVIFFRVRAGPPAPSPWPLSTAGPGSAAARPPGRPAYRPGRSLLRLPMSSVYVRDASGPNGSRRYDHTLLIIKTSM